MIKCLRFFLIVCISILLNFLVIPSAMAVDIPAGVPNAFDPGITQNRLQEPILAQPTLKAQITKPKEEQDYVTPGAEKVFFKLTDVVFSGNTVYSDQELGKIFNPLLHRKISVADLQKAVHDITVKYRSAGYILSRAILPPQTIDKGVVHVQVIEGYVSSIDVTGDCKTRGLIYAYAYPVLRSRPLKITVLEHAILLSNDVPGVSAQSVLTPSKTVPAAADLSIVTQRKWVDASVYYDNYGTRFLGPQQVTVNTNIYSIFRPGDSTGIRYAQTTHKNEMAFGELTHSQLIDNTGTRLLVGSDYTQTRPGFTLQPFNIIGRSFLLFGDVSHPCIRSRTFNVFYHGTFNYQNVTSTILGTPFYQDRVRSVVVGGSVDGVDHWQGVNNASLDIEHGFPIWGAHTHLLQSRPNGQTIFTKLNLNLSRVQAFYSRFSVLAALEGQYSFEPLLVSEQFAYGGPYFGRGYDPAEIVGDIGVGAKIEVRMDTAPEFKFLNAVQYYVFYDAGEIWNRDKINLPGKQSATSTGFGARINFMPHLTGNVFLGKPLTRQVSVLQQQPGQMSTAARVFFQAVATL